MNTPPEKPGTPLSIVIIARRAAALIAGLVLLAVLLLWGVVALNRPLTRGEIRAEALRSPLQIDSDHHLIPHIQARGRDDAYLALGYLHARDRLFQLELGRRAHAGELAEIAGERLLQWDIQQRHYGFRRAAKQILPQLPAPQQRVLNAYSDGINQYLGEHHVLPFEFQLLGFSPARWTPEDSLVIATGMFQVLNTSADREPMLTVMQQTLPADLVAFLTPDTDRYTRTLAGGRESFRPIQPVPLGSIRRVLNKDPTAKPIMDLPPEATPPGSNAWAVNGSRTTDGRAILANDMHLPLMIPNLWYRAKLSYAKTRLSGITLPGLPLVISGSNGRVAWGLTNSLADVMDRVALRIHPQDPRRYRTASGWRRFRSVVETIRVRGRAPASVNIDLSVWGPVDRFPLAGRRVALRWSALDPAAVNLDLLNLDRATTVEEAMEVFNRAGMPPLNAVLADSAGNIGWTLGGRIPRRTGHDGSISVYWDHRGHGWDGYLAADWIPRRINPQEGFIVSANNRMIGSGFPYPLGQNFANGYRAGRIRELLQSASALNEPGLLEFQSDSRAGIYDFYRRLALDSLQRYPPSPGSALDTARLALQQWDGHARSHSTAFGILFRLRRRLAGEILLPMMKPCYSADNRFYYSWFNMDTPLRQILQQQPREALPPAHGDADWAHLIVRILQKTVNQLQDSHGVETIAAIDWGRINRVQFSHPFSVAFRPLSLLLDIPVSPQHGCTFCVNVMSPRYGVSQRLIVSPGHEQHAILHMPGGQSGNPLSDHYRDQHRYWEQIRPLPLEPGPPVGRLRLLPR